MWRDLDSYTVPEWAHSALIVIDTQVDFVDGGASPIPGTSEVLPVIRRLLSVYRAARRPIVHVVRLYEGEDVDLPRRALIASGAQLVRPGSPGSQIVPTLLPSGAGDLDHARLLGGEMQRLAESEWAMWKPRWGAFHRTPLHVHLKTLDVSTVVLAGCNYPNCPRATVYGASERDYRVLVVADAISGIRADHLDEAARMGVAQATSDEIGMQLAALAPTSVP